MNPQPPPGWEQINNGGSDHRPSDWRPSSLGDASRQSIRRPQSASLTQQDADSGSYGRAGYSMPQTAGGLYDSQPYDSLLLTTLDEGF